MIRTPLPATPGVDVNARPLDRPQTDGAAPVPVPVPVEFPADPPTGPAPDARPHTVPLEGAFQTRAANRESGRPETRATEPRAYEPVGFERFEAARDLYELDAILTQDPALLALFQANRSQMLAAVEGVLPADLSSLGPNELATVLAELQDRASETATTVAKIPDDALVFRQAMMGELNARMLDVVEVELSSHPAFPGGTANWQVLARDFGLAWNIANEDIAEYGSNWDDIRDPSHPFGSRRGGEIETLSFFLPVAPLDRPLPDTIPTAMNTLFPEQDASEIEVYVTDEPAHTARGQNFFSVPLVNLGHIHAALGADANPERARWEEDRIIANEMAHAAFDRAYPDFGEREYDFPAFGALEEPTPSMVYELASDAVSVQLSRTPIADTFGSAEPNYALTREVVRSALLDFGFTDEQLEALEGLSTQRSRTGILLAFAGGLGGIDELRDTVRTRLMEQAQTYLGHVAEAHRAAQP